MELEAEVMVESHNKPEPRLKDRLEAIISEMIEKGILFNDALTHFEKQYIAKVLNRNRGNVTKTAQALGIHRNTLSSKLEKHKLY